MCSVYLDLFRIRYDGRLETEIEVDPEIQSASIIKSLVQPIVENYIVHGFRPLEDNNKISVRAYGAGDRVVIVVSDNGTGIPEEKLTQIRGTLNKVLQSPEKGHRSIGLMNVHERIVLNYGNDYGVTINSTEGQGTEVRMEIPMLRKGRRHEEGIFVDDEPLIAQGLATIVDWQDYDLHVSGSANDGLQALERLKEEPVDLLITDIMMPRMNGLELIKKVKEMHPCTKFIVLSGYEEFEYVKVGITLGIQNYILKPINIEELEATIKHIRGDWEREELKRFRSEEDWKILRDNILRVGSTATSKARN